MRNTRNVFSHRWSSSSLATPFIAVATATVFLVVGLNFVATAPASAAGTTANTISAKTPPPAGSAGGTFTTGASATSGDTVIISLDATSTGCTLAGTKLSFTGTGSCVIDFNDAGNTTYAAANQVQQHIHVYSTNEIHPSTAPTTGIVHDTYSASATATSGDTVVITLDGNSTGCTIKSGKVSFTAPGTCLVDFNDPGNGAFAAATQIRQSITVRITALKAQAPLYLTSTNGYFGTPIALSSSGGSGSGVVSYALTNAGSAGCSVSNGILNASRVGTCLVTATKAGDATYLEAHSNATTVSFARRPISAPRAFRMSSAVLTGRSIVTSIIGVHFYGRPRISSSVGRTRIGVLRDTGRVLTVRVTISSSVRRGVHTFFLLFAHGQRASVRYNQR
ncbi:MAG TPA: hypothetical protein VMU68_03610 [Acidimicrobiales bacterium]|nr:hypothetical protein [Acidimicrobiales bacterium]